VPPRWERWPRLRRLLLRGWDRRDADLLRRCFPPRPDADADSAAADGDSPRAGAPAGLGRVQAVHAWYLPPGSLAHVLAAAPNARALVAYGFDAAQLSPGLARAAPLLETLRAPSCVLDARAAALLAALPRLSRVQVGPSGARRGRRARAEGGAARRPTLTALRRASATRRRAGARPRLAVHATTCSTGVPAPCLPHRQVKGLEPGESGGAGEAGGGAPEAWAALAPSRLTSLGFHQWPLPARPAELGPLTRLAELRGPTPLCPAAAAALAAAAPRLRVLCARLGGGGAWPDSRPPVFADVVKAHLWVEGFALGELREMLPALQHLILQVAPRDPCIDAVGLAGLPLRTIDRLLCRPPHGGDWAALAALPALRALCVSVGDAADVAPVSRLAALEALEVDLRPAPSAGGGGGGGGAGAGASLADALAAAARAPRLRTLSAGGFETHTAAACAPARPPSGPQRLIVRTPLRADEADALAASLPACVRALHVHLRPGGRREGLERVAARHAARGGAAVRGDAFLVRVIDSSWAYE
jgi:hypothetical protein